LDEFPLGTLAIALAVLLILSGFFSIAETAMMAANRYRLEHRAKRGNKGAKLALALLVTNAQDDRHDGYRQATDHGRQRQQAGF